MSNRTARPSDMLQRELGLIEPIASSLTGSALGPPRRAERMVRASVGVDRRGRWNSVAWGATGFVAGALFWHSIGFWSFVQTTLVPTPDSRRVERDAGTSDTRVSNTSTSPSPVRQLRTSAKIAGRHEPSPPTVAATGTPIAAQTGTPVAALTVAGSSKQVVGEAQPNCTVIARAKDGTGGAVQSCTPAPVPLVDGAGLALADKQPAKAQAMKPMDSAKAPPIVWQAKVEVNTPAR
jgi:hypothetical protein